MLLEVMMFSPKVDMQRFTFTSQEDYPAISGVLDFVESKAAEFGASRKDSVSMCEESLVKLLKYADFSDGKTINAEVSARKFMGSVRFTLRVPGESFDFLRSLRRNVLPDSEEFSPDADDAINNIFLQLFEDRLKYATGTAITIYVSPHYCAGFGDDVRNRSICCEAGITCDVCSDNRDECFVVYVPAGDSCILGCTNGSC